MADKVTFFVSGLVIFPYFDQEKSEKILYLDAFHTMSIYYKS